MERTEFGYTRTACACPEDILNCYFLPGNLIPADLPRMMELAGYSDPFAYAEAHLLASPGALVGMNDGTTFYVPTLVPARNTHGGCRFLNTTTDQCTIHPAAPYACAFFDVHTPEPIADLRARSGIIACIEDHQANGIYSQLWHHLVALDKKAPVPIINKIKLSPALRLIKRGMPLDQVKQSSAWPFPETETVTAAEKRWQLPESLQPKGSHP